MMVLDSVGELILSKNVARCLLFSSFNAVKKVRMAKKNATTPSQTSQGTLEVPVINARANRPHTVTARNDANGARCQKDNVGKSSQIGLRRPRFRDG